MIAAIVRRPVSVIVATVAVCALGAFSLFKLPLALLPSIERPSLVITAKADASSRDEMLHEVTEPIERRLPSVPGITSIESETTDGEARITIRSAWQTDADRLRIDVARRIEGAANVPLDELLVETAGSDVLPVVEVAVTGASGATRTRIAERVLVPELARIEGAGKIEVIGATPLRVAVEPRAAALAARGLTAADVEERLRTVGATLAAGRVRDGAAVRPVVVAQNVRSVDDVRALLVKGVPLGEVANVALREISDETSVILSAAKDPLTPERAVLLKLHRAPNANAVALSRAVQKRINDLTLRDVKLHIVADRSHEVGRALAELALAAILGVLLGTLILRWILGHWRPTLALAVVVPVALLASFTVFHAMGIPLDVISLAGLALATGLLVDNSIVVLESIENARANGLRDPIVAGTKQIVVAVVASSITLVVVFAPLLYLRGLARAIFGEQAVAVVASVAASLVLSLTLTPVLARGRGAASEARNPGQARYLELLQRAFARPRRAAFVAVALTLLGLSAAFLLPRELFARGASRSVEVEMRLRDASMWERAQRAAGNDVRSMSMTTIDDVQTMNVEFETPRAAQRSLAALRDALPGARVRLRGSAFVESIGGDAHRVELIASAATDAEAEALAQRVDAEARKRGLVPVHDQAHRPTTAMLLRWDEARIATNAIDRRVIERDLRAGLGELDLGRVEVGGAESSIRLLPTLTGGGTSSLPVHAGANVVPLAAVAAARHGLRAPVAFHDEGRPARRLVYETALARSAGEGSRAAAGEGLWRTITGRGPSPCAHCALSLSRVAGEGEVRVAGHARELADAYAQMTLAAILAIALLYLTVAAFYESLLLPLLVMAALPFAAGGGLAALLVTGQSLNIMSLIGLIFLGGVVVNHTVVLLDRAEQLRRDGVDEHEAVRRAAADRYRPVMMTTITAILGMLPLALMGGDGVELRRAVAVVVIGGLVTATAGTLLLIPLLHRAIEPLRSRTKRVARLVEAAQ